MSWRQPILDRLRSGPATLADLRAALPTDDHAARALPSMGEPDPFGTAVGELVTEGAVLDEEGRYRLPGG